VIFEPFKKQFPSHCGAFAVAIVRSKNIAMLQKRSPQQRGNVFNLQTQLSNSLE
jgi:hypothetical protein